MSGVLQGLQSHEGQRFLTVHRVQLGCCCERKSVHSIWAIGEFWCFTIISVRHSCLLSFALSLHGIKSCMCTSSAGFQCAGSLCFAEPRVVGGCALSICFDWRPSDPSAQSAWSCIGDSLDKLVSVSRNPPNCSSLKPRLDGGVWGQAIYASKLRRAKMYACSLQRIGVAISIMCIDDCFHIFR